MHPVLIDQLARLHRAELQAAADRWRVVALATRRNRRTRAAAPAQPGTRMTGEAAPCPP